MTDARQFAEHVVRQLVERGFVALWAGGCVRDSLRGRVPGDYDVATNARPEQVREVFGARRTLAVGESFGVVIVLGPHGHKVEVATFRSEGPYSDGRRPDHVAFSTPEQDAQRRDFTINGMFFDPLTETIHDYVGGEADLSLGVLRAIGVPADRMREDKLRLLRAVRFTAVMDFTMDAATATAVRDMASDIVLVSAERIAQELRKMLVDSHRRRAVELLVELGLLGVILPEVEHARLQRLDRWDATLRALESLHQPTFALALGLLCRDVESPAAELRRDGQSRGTVRALGRRLKLSNDEIQDAAWLVHQQSVGDTLVDSPQPAPIKRFLVDPLSPSAIDFFRAVAIGQQLAPVVADRLDVLRLEWGNAEIDPPPLLTGADLIRLGYQPGKVFKSVLDQIRDAQLNGEISTSESAESLAKRLL